MLRRIGTTFIEMPPRAKVGAAIAVVVLLLATTALVYATGGVRFAYLHFMYVPVVLAGFAFGVPGGIFTVTGPPLRVGTLMSAPSAASSKLTGTDSVRLSALRPNSGWLATFTVTYRSPAGPPRSPLAPLPRSRIRWPSLTPAGIRAWIERADMPRPEPWQVGHASS